jgi:hypothetical protein
MAMDARLIKVHRSYRLDEAAQALGVHKNTVANWLRYGLMPIDGNRPVLIHGTELRRFLAERRRRRKSPCKIDEFWCLRCRAPRRPDGGLVDFVPMSASRGNLRGLCFSCGCLMHRSVSQTKLAFLTEFFDIAFPQDQSRLRDCTSLSPNCDFEGAADERANIQC